MLYVGDDKYKVYVGSQRLKPVVKALPYDAEVEYLESTGTQYIDTRYKPNQDTRVVATMQCVTSNSYGRLFGADKHNAVGGYMIDYENNATGTLHIKYGANNAWTNVSSVKGDYNVHTYDYNKNVVYRDGIQVSSTTYTAFQSTSNLGIFTYINGSAVGSATEWFKGRVFAFKIYDNDILVRDFIPVRVGQIGYLYDKVSGELFGNVGTGSFVIPFDDIIWYKKCVYIQNTVATNPSAYINTGVAPDAPIYVEIKFKNNQTSFSKWRFPFGSRKTAGVNIYGVFYSESGYIYYQDDTREINTGVSNDNNIHVVKYGNGSFILDEDIIGEMTGTYSSSYPILLFTENDNNTNTINASFNFVGNIYYCKIYKNNIIVRDFVPVMHPTGIYGMFDKVENKFYISATSTSFSGEISLDAYTTNEVYTSEIEYIEGTGTQYIYTGFINTVNTEFNIDFQLTDSTGDRKIIGQGSKFGLGQLDNKWRTVGSTWFLTSVSTDTNRHTAYTDAGKYYLDDTLLADRSSYNVVGTVPMLLFAVSSQNSIVPDGNCAKMRLYSCKIYDNDVLVRDYIPVRIGSIGCLYDKITDRCFINFGTGDFILGNDVN